MTTPPKARRSGKGINPWMRTKPTQIKPGLSDDHIRGHDAGYAAMAAGIDLALLN